MADSAAWTLSGIEPPDNTFRGAGETTHRAFWRFISSIGIDRFHWRCNQGLDRHGVALTPIRHSTWLRGRKRSYTGLGNASNPPLVPALGLSRTEALLKGRGFADHAEWYWTEDPVSGLHWGQVMLWHRAGGGGRYPQRDVIGWSTADIAWLRAQGQTWWYHYRNGHAIAAAMNELETRAEKFPRLAAQPPVKIAVTGRTDYEHYTFGIGGTEQMSRRAHEEGMASGFSKAGRYRPGRGPVGAKPKPKPTPMMPAKATPPAPARRRPAAVAQPAARAASKTTAKPAAAKWVNPYDAMPALNPLMHEREPLPTPDLATFAARAKAAAASVGAAGRVGRKVLISHAHAAYQRSHGPIPLPEYKSLLGRAVHARHLDLSRADMVEALDILDVRASHTLHPSGGAEYHFLHAE